MLTYLPLSLRSGHSSAKIQGYVQRLKAKSERYEQALIDRVDQERRNSIVAEKLERVGRDKRGRVIDSAWALRAN